MARVPFNTDNIKRDYLKQMATTKICYTCDNFCSSECKLDIIDVNRNVLKNAQDLFEVTFSCPRDLEKNVMVSKFFLPNVLFEEEYIQKVKKMAESETTIFGRKILDELLNWGRLEITEN